MAFCTKCGSSVADQTAFCPNCGAAVGQAVPAGTPVAVPAGPPLAVPAAQSGLTENVAGGLCYALGWITGIIFLLVDKRPFVRFHAAQSIVVFGILNILRVVLTFGWFGIHYYGFFSVWALVSLALSVITVIAWLVLMITAFQGKRLEVPIAAGIAKSLAGNA
jgi:uncharacterized membrane protein